jgi:hypothetical protein
MEIEPLVESILAAVALLENSPDAEIDPEVAVQGLESMAHALSDLGEDEVRQEFVAAVERVAERQAGPGAKEFYLSVPQILGVVP